MKLVLATSNPGKLEEFRFLLAGKDLDLLTPAGLDLSLEVEETGTNYLENAALKARAYAEASGLWSLADDTGLEVETLGGAPGVYSARYAPGADVTDADRRDYLLRNLDGHDRPWKARFVCIAALAGPDGSLYHHRGECPGEIIPEEQGKGGFGYDAVFLVSDRGLTMAELSLEEKNQLSHRARAVTGLLPRIDQLSRDESGR